MTRKDQHSHALASPSAAHCWPPPRPPCPLSIQTCFVSVRTAAVPGAHVDAPPGSSLLWCELSQSFLLHRINFIYRCAWVCLCFSSFGSDNSYKYIQLGTALLFWWGKWEHNVTCFIFLPCIQTSCVIVMLLLCLCLFITLILAPRGKIYSCEAPKGNGGWRGVGREIPLSSSCFYRSSSPVLFSSAWLPHSRWTSECWNEIWWVIMLCVKFYIFKGWNLGHETATLIMRVFVCPTVAACCIYICFRSTYLTA